MTEQGFYQPKRTNPTALAVVLLLHGTAITALALSKMEFVVKDKGGPIDIELIENPAEPPPEPIDQPLPPSHRTVIETVKPIVDRDVVIPDWVDNTPVQDFTIERTLPGDAEPQHPDPVVVPRDPVRVDARMDPRSELQPPYPASEQRLGKEGSVAIRLVIGPDGKVKAAEKVRATSDAFYAVTERHALRNWRFKPATVDGKPVEARKVVTVTFRLDG
jgi:protein TonB